MNLKQNIAGLFFLVLPIAVVATPDIAVVKIGIAVPMTGPISHLGKDIESGAKLAFEKVNAEHLIIGGKQIKFEMVTDDDQSDPRIATQVANRLVDKKVVAVIGHYNSGTSIPASRIYAAVGIPQISPGSTNPIYTQQGFATTLRNIANDDQQGLVLANFAYDQLKARNIVVIDDRTAAGYAVFGKAFTEKYGEMYAYAPYSYDAAMILVEAMKLSNSTDPDKFVQEIRKIRYNGVTGMTEFDSKGDIKNGVITLYQVKNGKWVMMAVSNDAM